MKEHKHEIVFKRYSAEKKEYKFVCDGCNSWWLSTSFNVHRDQKPVK